MKQEVIAAIAVCVMVAGLLFVVANKIRSIAEKRKTTGGKGPSKSFFTITRVLGVAFVAAGLGLLEYGN